MESASGLSGTDAANLGGRAGLDSFPRRAMLFGGRNELTTIYKPGEMA